MIHYEIPSSLDEDILRFANDLAEFKAGRIHETAFTAKRVKMGVYLERNYTTYMCRIRCGGNIITPEQLAAVARLARQYGDAKVHVTTRAEVQIYKIKDDDVVSVLQALKQIGLSCKGGGGNTIRNIVTNHDSGINPDEVFDVQPCLVALTNRLLVESDSWDLPRKIKIAFSSLDDKTAFCLIQDIGFVAKLNYKGEQGFKVYIGGGLGSRPKAGVPLHEFIPENEVYHVVKAIKNMFNVYGNRRNKHRNRIKFLLHDDLGEAAFSTYYQQELAKVLDRDYPKLRIEPIDNAKNISRDIDLAPCIEKTGDFRTWKKRNVRVQKQDGLRCIRLPLFAGNLHAEDCEKLKKCLRPFGANTLRCGTDQNLYLINIPERFLANVYRVIMGCDTLSDRPMLYGNVVSCTGARNCQVGINNPGPATEAIFQYLDKVATDFCPPNDILLRISGCPNSCANHWIGDLGFYGKVRRVAGHLIPTYNVIGNGGVHKGKLRLAEIAGWVHAYDLPRFITEVMRRYADFKENAKQSVDFNDYWRSGGRGVVEELCKSGYNDIPLFKDDKNYYFDHGAEQLFSIKDIGQAECSAGIYDMINVDDQAIKKNLRRFAEWNKGDTGLNALLKDTLFRSAGMLMVTRGEEPKTEQEVYTLFAKLFIDTGIVSESHRCIIDSARLGRTDQLHASADEVVALGKEITALYKNMDNTMRFPGETENMAISPADKKVSQDTETPPEQADRFKDLSGVKCPLNFAQTKVQLSAMHSGETLEIRLDDGPPIDNVPGSVKLDGHTILRQEKIGDQWAVLIKKA